MRKTIEQTCRALWKSGSGKTVISLFYYFFFACKTAEGFLFSLVRYCLSTDQHICDFYHLKCYHIGFSFCKWSWFWWWFFLHANFKYAIKWQQRKTDCSNEKKKGWENPNNGDGWMAWKRKQPHKIHSHFVEKYRHSINKFHLWHCLCDFFFSLSLC